MPHFCAAKIQFDFRQHAPAQISGKTNSTHRITASMKHVATFSSVYQPKPGRECFYKIFNAHPHVLNKTQSLPVTTNCSKYFQDFLLLYLAQMIKLLYQGIVNSSLRIKFLYIQRTYTKGLPKNKQTCGSPSSCNLPWIRGEPSHTYSMLFFHNNINNIITSGVPVLYICMDTCTDTEPILVITWLTALVPGQVVFNFRDS